MFLLGRKKYIERLEKENRDLRVRLDNSEKYYEIKRSNIKRIKESKIVFEQIKDINNLYIDDRLEIGYELTLYDSKTPIENSMTHGMSKSEAKLMKEITIVGYLEIDYWDWDVGKIKVRTLYVEKKYRRNGYATKMLKRLIECAKYYDVKEIVLTACADGDIKQNELEEFYEKCGFEKVAPDNNTMIYTVK